MKILILKKVILKKSNFKKKVILNVCKTQWKTQTCSEFNANYFIEHKKILLNKNAISICGYRKEFRVNHRKF